MVMNPSYYVNAKWHEGRECMEPLPKRRVAQRRKSGFA